ncbi:MAG: glycosyltransferase family 2 protein [Candidatus Korobacteraceae bacterium]
MFSLIVATIDRVSELDRLLTSLDAQTYRDFEVIIIDQNTDARLTPVLQRHGGLAIRHLQCERGAGRARNAGLRVARGEVIGFPDDDCWYPASLLESVRGWLERNRDFDAIFTTMRDEKNQPVGPPWPSGPVLVTRANLWKSTIFVTGFLRRAVTDAVGNFREDIGVGANTPYQSGEESDYFLRGLALGFRMRYEPALTVHHPNLHSIERMQTKTYPYALGCGYVLRIHGYSWREFGALFVRSIGGAVFSLCKGNITMAKIYWMRAAGQLRGYCFGPRDLARVAEPRTH